MPTLETVQFYSSISFLFPVHLPERAQSRAGDSAHQSSPWSFLQPTASPCTMFSKREGTARVLPHQRPHAILPPSTTLPCSACTLSSPTPALCRAAVQYTYHWDSVSVWNIVCVFYSLFPSFFHLAIYWPWYIQQHPLDKCLLNEQTTTLRLKEHVHGL